MAWPLSPIQTFIQNAVPVIRASFLNQLQSATVALFNGVISIKALVVDRVGANVVTPTSPTIGTTIPGPAPIRGEFARDAGPAAMGHCSGGFIDNAGGGLLAGYGIYELHRSGAGSYYVIFTRAPSGGSASNSVVTVTGGAPVTWTKSIDNGRLKLSIVLDGAVDLPFDVVAWIF